MVVTIEGVNATLNREMLGWLQRAIQLAGVTRYVQPTEVSTRDAEFAEVTIYLDVHAQLDRLRQHIRMRDLRMIYRHPARYVVIDTTLPVRDQRETAWMALVAKLTQQGVPVCHKPIREILYESQPSEIPIWATSLKRNFTA